MFYVDSQFTGTRRESSLITGYSQSSGVPSTSTQCAPSPSYANSQSTTSLIYRPRGSVRKEMVSLFFESMIDSVVKSWETIETKGNYVEKTESVTSYATDSKRKKSIVKMSRTKKSRSRVEVDISSTHLDPKLQVWWSSPDEIAIIHFRNGNKYEGHISMKCMNGQGRYQWRDGTVYLGEFHNNEITGKGTLHWKDDTWYDGEFFGNIRHGTGIYVNSREQTSYIGQWYNGTKHGKGVMYYDKTFKNNYDGDWDHNVRHGFGSREYSASSGYEGNWDRYIRDGKGLMIWENHDYYKGEWKNGVMSGYGTYFWNVQCNNILAMPVITIYRGEFERDERNGVGALNFGLKWGAHYKGDFKKNKKSGLGKLINNNGLILEDNNLYQDDNMCLAFRKPNQILERDIDEYGVPRPFEFDICTPDYGLSYHIIKAYENLDKSVETTASIINSYILYNRPMKIDTRLEKAPIKEVVLIDSRYNKQDIDFEETALRNAVRSHQSNLLSIYNKYSAICVDKPFNCKPILIRLFLWQFFRDCKTHEKGLTLVEIDNMFHANPAWLSKTPHNPFQKIFFWQFLHSIILTATKLYARSVLPGPKPDTIVATAFRKFMDEDVLPGYGSRCGNLTRGFGTFIPLKALYGVYLTIGEPHTVRQFICSIRRSLHDTDHSFVHISDASADISLGQNIYIFGDQISFVMDDVPLLEKYPKKGGYSYLNKDKDLILFNFCNLSTRTLIKIFSNIFPQLLCQGKIMSLDIEMTFYEFFEAFVVCAEESIRLREEEICWKELVLKKNKGHAHPVIITSSISSPPPLPRLQNLYNSAKYE